MRTSAISAQQDNGIDVTGLEWRHWRHDLARAKRVNKREPTPVRTHTARDRRYYATGMKPIPIDRPELHIGAIPLY